MRLQSMLFHVLTFSVFDESYLQSILFDKDFLHDFQIQIDRSKRYPLLTRLEQCDKEFNKASPVKAFHALSSLLDTLKSNSRSKLSGLIESIDG